jgi:hypothetical protein
VENERGLSWRLSGDQLRASAKEISGKFRPPAFLPFGTIVDASLSTDALAPQYRGDTTVSADAGALPDLKAFGTLTDLRTRVRGASSLAGSRVPRPTGYVRG